MSSPTSTYYTIFSNKNSTGDGVNIFCKDFRHKAITIATTGIDSGDSIVIKFKLSLAETCPDFSSASSASNTWEYVKSVQLLDGSAIDGDTGLTIENADAVHGLILNIDTGVWLTAEVVSISDTVNTSVTATCLLQNF